MPEVNVFNMPFVFRNQAHMREVIDGPIGEEMLDKITASSAKLVALGWMDGGSRSLYTKKPVRKPADLKGMKIRMMGNPLFVDTMNAMGGNGICMGYGEVFSALQTGVVDGAENNPPSFFTSTTIRPRQVLHPDRPPDHSRDLRDVEGDLGQADAGRPGAGEEVRARGAVRAARLWDKSVAEYDAKLKAAGVEFIARSTTRLLRRDGARARQVRRAYADLIKRIEAVQVSASRSVAGRTVVW